MGRVVVDLVAPDFSMREFDGEMFRLSDLRGSKNVLVVLNRGFV